jgi:hypothetical protein
MRISIDGSIRTAASMVLAIHQYHSPDSNKLGKQAGPAGLQTGV